MTAKIYNPNKEGWNPDEPVKINYPDKDRHPFQPKETQDPILEELRRLIRTHPDIGIGSD